MKKFAVGLLVWMTLSVQAQSSFTLKNGTMEVVLDARGNLLVLKNLQTGHNYASGGPLWRLHYDRPDWKDNPVFAADNQPTIQQDGDRIVITYNRLKGQRESLNATLTLKGWLYGTDLIERVEIISAGKTLRAFQPNQLDVELTETLPTEGWDSAYFYLRLRQKDGHRAWCSPVWVDKK